MPRGFPSLYGQCDSQETALRCIVFHRRCSAGRGCCSLRVHSAVELYIRTLVWIAIFSIPAPPHRSGFLLIDPFSNSSLLSRPCGLRLSSAKSLPQHQLPASVFPVPTSSRPEIPSVSVPKVQNGSNPPSMLPPPSLPFSSPQLSINTNSGELENTHLIGSRITLLSIDRDCCSYGAIAKYERF